MEPKQKTWLVNLFWALLIIAIVVGIAMGVWIKVDRTNCEALNDCGSAQGLGQGAVIASISFPAIVISFLGSIILYIYRKKKSLPILARHKVLLGIDLILFILICYVMRNYIGDVIESIFGF